MIQELVCLSILLLIQTSVLHQINVLDENMCCLILVNLCTHDIMSTFVVKCHMCSEDLYVNIYSHQFLNFTFIMS
jgi:hypothetical protein